MPVPPLVDPGDRGAPAEPADCEIPRGANPSQRSPWPIAVVGRSARW